MMGTLPIVYYVNQALDNHAKGINKIVPKYGPKALHVNFI